MANSLFLAVVISHFYSTVYVRRSKHSEDNSHETAAPGAGRREEGRPGKTRQKKVANKIIAHRRRKGMVYVGVDLHKKNAQIAAADEREKILMNRKIPHTREAIRYEALHLPKHARYVIESSSVWEDTYRYMTEELGLDVIVSNPYTTLLIAKSKKKTDKVDAAVLADMLRGDFISQCYTAEYNFVNNRQI